MDVVDAAAAVTAGADCIAIDAVAMDNRDRMRSRGYVVPVEHVRLV